EGAQGHPGGLAGNAAGGQGHARRKGKARRRRPPRLYSLLAPGNCSRSCTQTRAAVSGRGMTTALA
ncbi:unnamed protein product, partial [Ectocarpus sp. 12 AP-2014]